MQGSGIPQVIMSGNICRSRGSLAIGNLELSRRSCPIQEDSQPTAAADHDDDYSMHLK